MADGICFGAEENDFLTKAIKDFQQQKQIDASSEGQISLCRQAEDIFSKLASKWGINLSEPSEGANIMMSTDHPLFDVEIRLHIYSVSAY